jgi:hypothetical protein
MSEKEICPRCGTSPATIAKLERDLTGYREYKTLADMARQLNRMADAVQRREELMRLVMDTLRLPRNRATFVEKLPELDAMVYQWLQKWDRIKED